MPPLLTLQLLPPLPSSGHVDKVREQLKMGANVNTRDNASWTPLVRHRTTHGQQQVAAMSYARLATQLPDCPPESQHEACAGGFTEIVELLLDAGADVNATASNGLTALQIALYLGHAAVVRVLLAAPAITVAEEDRAGILETLHEADEALVAKAVGGA